MNDFLRRIYLSVASILFFLWLGMVVWIFKKNLPNFASLVSGPVSLTATTSAEWAPLFNIPGIRFSVYQVKSGESYSQIAGRFQLSERTLRSLNQANDEEEPKPGNSIFIPSQDGIFHVMRPGQSLSDVARAYGVSLGSILQFDHLTGDSDVQAGQVIYIPEGKYLTDKDVHWISLLALQDQKGFIKPTTGRFADGFGERINPISGKKEFHPGLDLAPGWRAAVVASQTGKVIFAGIRAGYGRLIILDHGNGLTSRYGHLDQIMVKLDQVVKQGELIGRVGMTGMATGPHLHFEIRLNGKPQNPLIYLTQ
jgi:murein DD-endopeptidase MepM/ murein hydrolase activator NlpD